MYMSKFKSLNIRTQLMLSYGAIVIFSIIIGIYAITQILSINRRYASSIEENKTNLELATEIMSGFGNLRLNVHDLIVYADNDTLLNEAKDNIDQYINALNENLESYNKSIADENLSQEQLDAVSEFENNFTSYCDVVYEVMDMVDNNKKTSASKTLNENKETSDYIFASAQNIYDDAAERLSNVTVESSKKATSALFIMIFVILVIVVISVLLSVIVSKILISSFKSLQNVAKEIAKGNLKQNLSVNENNEIGALTNSLDEVRETINSLTADINSTTELIDKGDIDARIDESKYSGGYETVAVSINKVIDSLLSNITDTIECMKCYADGNFDAEIKRFPGKMSIIHESMDKVKDNLRAVSSDVNELIASASSGDLNKKIDTSKYLGDWKNITNGLNSFVDEIKAPILEISSVLDTLSSGNLNARINKEFKGAFNSIKLSINNTIDNISSYIVEISDILTKMSQQNLDINIEREYIGDFKSIKDALDLIISRFNMLIGDITVSSEEIAEGAKQIADASLNLTSGILKQSTAVEALNSAIEGISTHTAENTSNANKAQGQMTSK